MPPTYTLPFPPAPLYTSPSPRPPNGYLNRTPSTLPNLNPNPNPHPNPNPRPQSNQVPQPHPPRQPQRARHRARQEGGHLDGRHAGAAGALRRLSGVCKRRVQAACASGVCKRRVSSATPRGVGVAVAVAAPHLQLHARGAPCGRPGGAWCGPPPSPFDGRERALWSCGGDLVTACYRGSGSCRSCELPFPVAI